MWHNGLLMMKKKSHSERKVVEVDYHTCHIQVFSLGWDTMSEKKDLQDCVEELRRERAQCSFDVEELTNIFDGGKGVTARRREIGEMKESFWICIFSTANK